MCYMIAVGLETAATAPAEHALGHRLLEAPAYVSSAFHNNEKVFILGVGHCACGLFSAPLDENGELKLRKKYQKRGWNDARVEKVISERRTVGGLSGGLVQRIAACANAIGSISVLIYWDNGSSTPPATRLVVSADDLINNPQHIREETVVRVCRSRLLT